MAKRRSRELRPQNGSRPVNGSGPAEVDFSSGVTLVIRPFSVGLWEDINVRGFEDYPDPVPPKKVIQALGGTEEIDDLENPAYLAEVARVKNERGNLLTEAVLDICPVINLADWEGTIRSMERYSSKFPEDPGERRAEFMTRFVLRTKADYEKLMMTALEQILIDDPEVSEKMKYFQRDLERAAAANNNAPGAAQGERVEVPQKG